VLVEWFETTIVDLLTSPPPGTPGPDVFSARFNRYFTPNATGEVNGESLDYEGLKTKLRALSGHFEETELEYKGRKQVPKNATTHGSVTDTLKWTDTEDENKKKSVVTNSEIVHMGQSQISFINLTGKPKLFK